MQQRTVYRSIPTGLQLCTNTGLRLSARVLPFEKGHFASMTSHSLLSEFFALEESTQRSGCLSSANTSEKK